MLVSLLLHTAIWHELISIFLMAIVGVPSLQHLPHVHDLLNVTRDA